METKYHNTPKTEEGGRQIISFAALDPFIDRLIESPVEKKVGDRMTWGERNKYPHYIKGLCRTVPTLRTVTRGLVDYVCGDSVEASHGLPGREEGSFDRRGTNARKLVKETSQNIADLGGFAWKITQNMDGNTGEIECIPVERIRTDEDNEGFWYSEKWEKGGNDVIFYPRWTKGTKCKESIFYVKLWGEGAYPEPIFAASVKACETERSIDTFHLSNIERGFMGSYVVNFCNGAMPNDQQKKEVERNFTEKFAGKGNAGRIMFAWCKDKDHQTTLQKMEVSDYGEKYKTLEAHCRQQIFTAFRANPNLFGVSTESTGFNSEEYDNAFRLFNRTMVLPIQQQILDAFDTVLGEKGVITIRPFTLDGYTETVK